MKFVVGIRADFLADLLWRVERGAVWPGGDAVAAVCVPAVGRVRTGLGGSLRRATSEPRDCWPPAVGRSS